MAASTDYALKRFFVGAERQEFVEKLTEHGSA